MLDQQSVEATSINVTQVQKYRERLVRGPIQ